MKNGRNLILHHSNSCSLCNNDYKPKVVLKTCILNSLSLENPMQLHNIEEQKNQSLTRAEDWLVGGG